MNSNDIIKKVYAAIVRKAQNKIAAGTPGQLAADVGDDVIAVGQTWTSAIGNDGKISDAEATMMTDVFGMVVDRRVPAVKNVGVTLLWEGFSLFGIGWRGLKYYLNKWFDLELD